MTFTNLSIVSGSFHILFSLLSVGLVVFPPFKCQPLFIFGIAGVRVNGCTLLGSNSAIFNVVSLFSGCELLK